MNQQQRNLLVELETQIAGTLNSDIRPRIVSRTLFHARNYIISDECNGYEAEAIVEDYTRMFLEFIANTMDKCDKDRLRIVFASLIDCFE